MGCVQNRRHGDLFPDGGDQRGIGGTEDFSEPKWMHDLFWNRTPRVKMIAASRMRWVMISLVFVATAINYLDRQTLSVVAPVLIGLYHMSNVTYSRIVFAFMLAYTVMNGVSGPLIDRLGTRQSTLGPLPCGQLRQCCTRSRSVHGLSAHFASYLVWGRQVIGLQA